VKAKNEPVILLFDKKFVRVPFVAVKSQNAKNFILPGILSVFVFEV
jgi:hypothetical protein